MSTYGPIGLVARDVVSEYVLFYTPLHKRLVCKLLILSTLGSVAGTRLGLCADISARCMLSLGASYTLAADVPLTTCP